MAPTLKAPLKEGTSQVTLMKNGALHSIVLNLRFIFDQICTIVVEPSPSPLGNCFLFNTGHDGIETRVRPGLLRKRAAHFSTCLLSSGFPLRSICLALRPRDSCRCVGDNAQNWFTGDSMFSYVLLPQHNGLCKVKPHSPSSLSLFCMEMRETTEQMSTEKLNRKVIVEGFWNMTIAIDPWTIKL